MSRQRADLTLVLIAMIWGLTFPLVHGVTQSYPPLSLIALRFCLALLGMAPLVLRAQSPRPLGRRGWLVALALGGSLYAGFITQTLGLQQTTAARGGFITGLNVVIVPFLALLILRQRPPMRALIGLAFALSGMIVLALDAEGGLSLGGLNRGDLLVLACAFAFALHIVLVSCLPGDLPAIQLNAAQLAVVALLASVTALAVDGLALPSLAVWGAAAFLGLVATALVFALQLAVQRHTTPTHTALIFALEPVFAAVFAVILGGEVLRLVTIAGGGLMLLGVLIAEAPPGRRVRQAAGARKRRLGRQDA